ncbi:MAG: hypothetical protein QOF42_636 [Gammaproteobacteria bacterium]|nr:hypothetical protein [Gammaproteobacteria bacterium]
MLIAFAPVSIASEVVERNGKPVRVLVASKTKPGAAPATVNEIRRIEKPLRHGGAVGIQAPATL